MNRKDPAVMQRIKDFAEQYYADHRLSPSIGTISKGIGEARSKVYTYLVEMDATGMLEYDGKNIITETTGKTADSVNVPAFGGPIPCGSPESIESQVEYYVSIPTVIFGSGEKFIIRTTGDSMNLAGINDGGYAVVDKDAEPKVGDIIVALTGDGENTLKRLAYDSEKRCYYLHPESTNPKHKDIYIDTLKCQGVVHSIINKY